VDISRKKSSFLNMLLLGSVAPKISMETQDFAGFFFKTKFRGFFKTKAKRIPNDLNGR
jgi:hypothetical protein